MSAQRLAVLVLALALVLAGSACESSDPGEAPQTGDQAVATVTSDIAATPIAAQTVDPAQLAAFDEQARADLAADVSHRVEVAQRVYGKDVPLRVESGLFVLVDAERGTPFEAAADLAQRGLDVYLGSLFARRPDRAVTVYVVRSASVFENLCDSRFPSGCERGLGAYSRNTRDIIVNVGPGLPSITHELVHPLMQTDFPRAPGWFEEGLASLFEKPVFEPAGEIHGATNWRQETLAAALASPAQRGKVSLRALFALNDARLDTSDQDLHYAMARAFCQWLDEHGQLLPFYRAWRDGFAGDHRGERSFAQVTGMTPAQAEVPWLEWVKARR
jgi:hypothetical protein